MRRPLWLLVVLAYVQAGVLLVGPFLFAGLAQHGVIGNWWALGGALGWIVAWLVLIGWSNHRSSPDAPPTTDTGAHSVSPGAPGAPGAP